MMNADRRDALVKNTIRTMLVEWCYSLSKSTPVDEQWAPSLRDLITTVEMEVRSDTIQWVLSNSRKGRSTSSLPDHVVEALEKEIAELEGAE